MYCGTVMISLLQCSVNAECEACVTLSTIQMCVVVPRENVHFSIAIIQEKTTNSAADVYTVWLLTSSLLSLCLQSFASRLMLRNTPGCPDRLHQTHTTTQWPIVRHKSMSAERQQQNSRPALRLSAVTAPTHRICGSLRRGFCFADMLSQTERTMLVCSCVISVCGAFERRRRGADFREIAGLRGLEQMGHTFCHFFH